MTHGNDDSTDIDEHLIWEGPFGIHFDSLEGKWVLIGIATAFLLVMTGSTELIAAIGLIALGARQTERFPKLAQLEAQPWWWVGGVMIGVPLWGVVRYGLEYLGIALPDIDYNAIVGELLRVLVEGGLF